MIVDLITGTREWIVPCVFFGSMLAAGEGGFRFGRSAQSRTAEKVKAQMSVVEASILGILALQLGFTMSMAVSRFEGRKQLVLEEANAIGTSYLRTQLLPRPQGTEIAKLLNAYIDARVRFVEVGEDQDRIEDARKEAVRLQDKFWSVAVDYAQKDPDTVRAGLLLQSLNRIIDLESARWMAFNNHVPATVIYVNAMLALLAVNLVGYAFGLEGQRQVFSMCLLVLSLTVVLAVIIDLDRPCRGFIWVGQQPMTDLQHQVRARN